MKKHWWMWFAFAAGCTAGWFNNLLLKGFVPIGLYFIVLVASTLFAGDLWE